MASTEIQKVPGNFNLPAGWPRLEFPDVTTGLVADWRADALPLGNFPADGWKSSVGSLPPLKHLLSASAPQVMQDAAGMKYLRFDSSRLAAAVDWSGDLTVLAVLNPDFPAGLVGRIVAGPGGAYRSLSTTGTGSFMAKTNAAGDRVLGTQAIPGRVTAVLARYSATAVDGKMHGQDWSSASIPSAVPAQKEVYVGAGAGMTADSILKAGLYRLQVWDRSLSKNDADAALQQMAAAYRIA